MQYFPTFRPKYLSTYLISFQFVLPINSYLYLRPPFLPLDILVYGYSFFLLFVSWYVESIFYTLADPGGQSAMAPI